MEVLAGSGSWGFADGAGAAAQFRDPSWVAVDGEGSIIIADWCNQRVRKLTPDGTVSTLAGSGSRGFADVYLTGGQIHSRPRFSLKKTI